MNDFIFGAQLSLTVPPLYPLMLYAKFQNFRPSGSGEDFLKVLPPTKWHGGYLGHVTWTIYVNFRPRFIRSLALISQAVSEKKRFEY